MDGIQCYIGIDPGTTTGVAVVDVMTKKYTLVTSTSILQAMEIIDGLTQTYQVKLFIENPNTWIPFRNSQNNANKLQGAGSIKRDYAIWLEYCKLRNIAFEPVTLHSAIKKIDAKRFALLTGYKGKTNSHGRDAAMMILKDI